MNIDLIIEIMADWAVIPIVLFGSIALMLKVPRGQRLMAYSRILMAGLTAYLLAKLIGSVFQPSGERPFELMGTVAGASFLNNPGFPSDHALFITAIVCAVWFETKSKWLSVTLAILVVVVCVGRVLALVHTPLDVIGGVVIALLGAVWYIGNQSRRIKVL